MSDVSPELERLFREESEERLERISHTLIAIERGDAPPDALDVLFRDAHSLKGVTGIMGYDEAYDIGHAMEDVLHQARDTGVLQPELVGPLLAGVDAMRQAVEGATGVAAAAIAAISGRSGSGESRGSPEPHAAAAVKPGDVPQSAQRPNSVRTMRVDAGRVDTVLETVGETVLHHRRLEHALRRGAGRVDEEEADDLLHRGDLLLDELQQSVIRLRTLPLATITAPYPRAMRDLAAAAGKEAELVLEGTETQLDRVVLDGAAEAIAHLLRNALAHGIEPPEERERAGKPRCARVVLRARPQGDRVAIEVADDGRGVAPELLARARRSGSLADVLAEPGRTTAESVTGLAGRGVGLDAVRDHVERLGGEFEIESRPGEGTVARLLLPVSLVLLHVLLVQRAGVTIGLPVASIAEVRQSGDRVTLSGRPALRVRDEVVPLRDLITALGGSAETPARGGPALLVTSGGQTVALLCDRVVGEEHLIVKPLGPLLEPLRTYLGSSILGDGGIALVADPARLVGRAERDAGPMPVSDEIRRATVLVVDDQFAVRELQRSILESAGYQVQTARDGREAWEALSAGPDPDLVITDLEMPDMDGLQLLAAIRARPQGASLPVVVLTSRGRPEEERQGLEAGADAYIVKERFDQQALVDTVARLIGS